MESEYGRLALELNLVQEPAAQGRIRGAIYRAGEAGYAGLAPQILVIAECTKDERTLETAAWAFGKLDHQPAQLILQRLLFHPNQKVVRGAAWALGQLENEAARAPLRRAYERSDDAELRQIIGGALKKIAGLSTRVYTGSVEGRLKPPKSVRIEVDELVKQLEQSDLQKDPSAVLELRRELRSLDPEYFQIYMEYRSQRTSALRLLESSRVYSRRT